MNIKFVFFVCVGKWTNSLLHRQALSYIARLDFESADLNLRRYGSALMRRLPDETTQLLKRLCNDYRPDGALLVTGEEEEVKAAQAEHFLHLFVRNSAQMVDFLEFVIRSRPAEASGGVYNTLLEHYLHQYSDPESTANLRKQMEEKAMDVLRRNVQNCDEDQALILCQRHSFSQVREVCCAVSTIKILLLLLLLVTDYPTNIGIVTSRW